MKKRERNIVYRRLIRSYLSSIITISMVLLLMALSAFIALNAKGLSNYLKENFKLTIIVTQETEEQEALLLYRSLTDEPFVKSAKFISKEQGEEEMRELLGEEFIELFDYNPIPISIEILLNAQYTERDSLAIIESRLEPLPEVRELLYQESLIETINENVEKISYIAMALITILVTISLILINGTVRLNLYSKRVVIYTMKLVGAKRSFIRKPLLVRAVWQGLSSGVISSGVMALLLYLLKRDLPELFTILDFRMMELFLIALPFVGGALSIVSTYFITNRLISMSRDDIYY